MRLQLSQQLSQEQLLREQIATLVELCQAEREAVREVRKALRQLSVIRRGIKRWLRGKQRNSGFANRVPWKATFDVRESKTRKVKFEKTNRCSGRV